MNSQKSPKRKNRIRNQDIPALARVLPIMKEVEAAEKMLKPSQKNLRNGIIGYRKLLN